MRRHRQNLRAKVYRASLARHTTTWMRHMQIIMLRGEVEYLRAAHEDWHVRIAQEVAFVARGMGL